MPNRANLLSTAGAHRELKRTVVALAVAGVCAAVLAVASRDLQGLLSPVAFPGAALIVGMVGALCSSRTRARLLSSAHSVAAAVGELAVGVVVSVVVAVLVVPVVLLGANLAAMASNLGRRRG